MADVAPRILIADDDDDLRELLVRRLGRRGWEVAEAPNGADAVRMAIAVPPDVIVLDRSMPVMGGVEALAALRADPATAEVPVMLLSAEDDAPGDTTATPSHTVRMRKPFEFGALEQALRDLAGI